MMIEIKLYQLNNGFTKLFRTSKMKNCLKFLMHLNSDNLEVMINVKENEFIQ